MFYKYIYKGSISLPCAGYCHLNEIKVKSNNTTRLAYVTLTLLNCFMIYCLIY